jgi:hypothetical protein
MKYALHDNVQHALRIPLAHMTIHQFNNTILHGFLLFLSWCFFFHEMAKKDIKRLMFASINTEEVIGKHYKRNTQLKPDF